MGNCRSTSQHKPKTNTSQLLDSSVDYEEPQDGNASLKRAHRFSNVNDLQYEYHYFQETKSSVKVELDTKSKCVILHYDLPPTDKEKNGPSKCSVNLTKLDDFSVVSYNKILEDHNIQKPKPINKTACLRSMVSQNRLRYTNGEFNLDLAYITKRVIAMGFPSEGMRQLYRNSLVQVLGFFKKHHNNKIKVYNMCDDSFIDVNKLLYNQGGIKVAYFPMTDHNPGSVKLLFYCILDQILFLAKDPDNSIAVHCKAGKGRTGVVVCAYLLFMEACSDAYEAIEFFNGRRTIDGKGLNVPSQKRYLHYFEKFIKSTFQSPYKQLISPYIKNPKCFESLFEPRNRLKLMSIFIGPFKTNPAAAQIKLSIRDYDKLTLFSNSNKKQKPYEQNVVFNEAQSLYYIIVTLTEEIVVSEDIYIEVKTTNIKNEVKIKFHYWLNVRYLLQGVGKVEMIPFDDIEQVGYQHFMQHEPSAFKLDQFSSFKMVKQSPTKKKKNESSGPKDLKSINTEQPLIDIAQNDKALQELGETLRASINKFEQNTLKRISARNGQKSKSIFNTDGNSPLITNQTYQSKHKQMDSIDEEIKKDAHLLKQRDSLKDRQQGIFSESEDDMCVVTDENEEQLPTNQKNYQDRGSFKLNPVNRSPQKQTTKDIHDFPILAASARKKLPGFPVTKKQHNPCIPITKTETVQSENESCIALQDEVSVSSQVLKNSQFSINEGSRPQPSHYQGGSINLTSNKSSCPLNQKLLLNQNNNPSAAHSRQVSSLMSRDNESVNNQSHTHMIYQQNNPFDNLRLSTQNVQVTGNFDQNATSESRLINCPEIDQVNLLKMKSPNYSASDESDKGKGSQSKSISPVQQQQLIAKQMMHKAAFESKERIQELNRQQSHGSPSHSSQNSISKFTNGSSNKLGSLRKNNLMKFNTQGIRNSVKSIGSYKGTEQSKRNNDMKKIVQAKLSAGELDKFKEINNYQDLRVLTTFYCNPALDQILLTPRERPHRERNQTPSSLQPPSSADNPFTYTPPTINKSLHSETPLVTQQMGAALNNDLKLLSKTQKQH